MSISTIQPTQLERTNLEAHVDLCAERYRTMEEKMSNIETRLSHIEKSVTSMREESIKAFSDMREQNAKSNSYNNKILLGAAGSIVAGVLTIIVTLLMTAA
jgi:vacuolar-type H+-ATPase subunit D/Vma8